MRSKVTPSSFCTTPAPSSPPKRRRTALDTTSNSVLPPPHSWAHAEFFISFVDDPYFSHSQFLQIMHTALALPLSRTTRLQLSRIRAAMCNAFPGAYAKPRRLSPSFLSAETNELCAYRDDARKLLRRPPPAAAAVWAERYCCPPPETPPVNAPIFVRTLHPPPHPRSQPANCSVYIRPAVFVALAHLSQIVVCFTDVPPDNRTQVTVSDLDVMVLHPPVAEQQQNEQQQQQQQQHSQNLQMSFLSPTRTPLKITAAPVHFSSTITTPLNPQYQQQNQNHHSPMASRFLFSPQNPSPHDPLSIENATPKFINSHLASSTPAPTGSAPAPNDINNNSTNHIPNPNHFLAVASNFYSSSSPLPLASPSPSSFQFPFQSPLRPIRSAASPDMIECEVDVSQLADSICLLDRKTELLYHLKSLNEQVEQEQSAATTTTTTTGTTTTTTNLNPNQDNKNNIPTNNNNNNNVNVNGLNSSNKEISKKYESLISELSRVEQDLKSILANNIHHSHSNNTLSNFNEILEDDGIVANLNFGTPEKDGENDANDKIKSIHVHRDEDQDEKYNRNSNHFNGPSNLSINNAPRFHHPGTNDISSPLEHQQHHQQQHPHQLLNQRYQHPQLHNLTASGVNGNDVQKHRISNNDIGNTKMSSSRNEKENSILPQPPPLPPPSLQQLQQHQQPHATRHRPPPSHRQGNLSTTLPQTPPPSSLPQPPPPALLSQLPPQPPPLPSPPPMPPVKQHQLDIGVQQRKQHINANANANANVTVHQRHPANQLYQSNINTNITTTTTTTTTTTNNNNMNVDGADVDFKNEAGNMSLAKALTKIALAKLPDSDALKRTPNALRADLMECVSACVTVLIRARVTKDFQCIEQVVENVPLKFNENAEALEAIHSAAKMFESSSPGP